MWAALALVLVIVFSPILSNAKISTEKSYWWDKAPPPIHNGIEMPKSWWEAAKLTSKHHGCNPFDIVAVMILESGPRPFCLGGQTVGNGPNGRKYIRPMGFNRKCKIPWEYMYVPEKQIYWAGRLLNGNLVARLKSYNKTWYKDRYIPGVLGTSRKLENEAFNKVYGLQKSK